MVTMRPDAKVVFTLYVMQQIVQELAVKRLNNFNKLVISTRRFQSNQAESAAGSSLRSSRGNIFTYYKSLISNTFNLQKSQL